MDQKSACYWCGKLLDLGSTDRLLKIEVDHLIRPDAGGANESNNLVGSCEACNNNKGTHDPLAWCQGSETRLARRHKALLCSHNHLLQVEFKTREPAYRMLERRFENARFTVSAHCGPQAGFIGWSFLSRMPPQAVMICKSYGAKLHKVGRWMIAELPRERFLDAIWMLIEVNAFVRRLNLGSAFPDATPEDPIRSRWVETYTDKGDIFRRRLPNTDFQWKSRHSHPPRW